MNPPPPPARRRRTALIAAGAAGGVLLVAALAYGLTKGGDGPSVAGSARAPEVTAPATPSATAPPGVPDAASPTGGTGQPTGGAVAPPGSSSASASQPPVGADGRRTVTDDDRRTLWSYAVPGSADWTVGNDLMSYVEEAGRVLVRASSPSYYRSGYCRGGAGVARSWVGWSSERRDDTSATVTSRWVAAVAQGPQGRGDDPHTPVRTRELPRAGGMTVRQSSSVVTLRTPDPQGCLPPQVEVTATQYSGALGSRTLVMVRDVAVRDMLPVQVKEQIFASVRQTR